MPAAPAAGWFRSASLYALLRDALGEQHVVDARLQRHEADAADQLVSVGVELGLDLAGMRRQHEDAVADDDRLLDRMGDEEHGEADILPKLQQLLLHLASR